MIDLPYCSLYHKHHHVTKRQIPDITQILDVFHKRPIKRWIRVLFLRVVEVADPCDVVTTCTDFSRIFMQMCFFRIILPLSVPGILSGITMVFVPGVTTFVISQFLGSGKVTLIGDIIEQQFLHAGNWGFGAAISLIVMVVVVLLMWIVNRFSDDTGVMMP